MFVLRVMYQLLNYWNIVGCILMRMMCRPKWPLLLMYGSHDMRHTGIPRVDRLSTDSREMGRHKNGSLKRG